jgi:hypothetical protein
MNRAVKYVLAANLVGLTILTFTYPNLMVGPGKLIVGHQDLEGDCFACHAPFTGASAERCVTCHKPADIGRLTTAAQPIAKPLTSAPFHQQLIKDDCMACHSDHAGVKRYRQTGSFNHDLLLADARNQCQVCHRPPTDSIHRQITANCGQCHAQGQWTPATYDHNQYFVLDRDHSASCTTCHERNDYSRYSCYGCHEHSQDKIRRKHIEEGIRDFKNCVECHRTADEHDIRGKGQEGGGHERKNKHDDD